MHPDDSSPTSDSEESLRPMGFTDILDSVFSLYRNHFRLFVSISAAYFAIGFVASLLDGISVLLISTSEHLSAVSALGNLVYWVPSLVTVVTILVRLVVTGSLFFCGAQIFLGERITARAAFKQTKRRFWSFFFSNLLYWTVVIALVVHSFLMIDILFLVEIYLPEISGLVIGVIMIVATIYVGVRWVFCSLAALLEGKSAIQALKRSGELVKGGWWRVFGMTLGILTLHHRRHAERRSNSRWRVFGMTLGILTLALFVQSILSFTWGLISGIKDNMQVDEEMLQEGSPVDIDLLGELASMFVPESPELTSWSALATYAVWSCISLAIECLVLPVGVIGITLVYFDRRIRKEGFDIEMRATSEAA